MAPESRANCQDVHPGGVQRAGFSLRTPAGQPVAGLGEGEEAPMDG